MATGSKVASDVARSVLRGATDQRLVEGHYVAAEHDLIKRFGAGRGSVREGLRLLEAMGTLRLRRGFGGGATLARPVPERLASSLALLLQWSEATLGTVVEARRIVEPTLAAFAAERRSEDDVLKLRALLSDLGAATADSERFGTINRDIHGAIAEAAGNDLLMIVVRSINWLSYAAAAGWGLPEKAALSVVKHKKGVIDAIADQNASLAMKRMQAAMQETERHGERMRLLERPIRWADVDELLAVQFHDD